MFRPYGGKTKKRNFPCTTRPYAAGQVQMQPTGQFRISIRLVLRRVHCFHSNFSTNKIYASANASSGIYL